ncbi:DinB family protein [Paenibacillus arenilitoris]|uniref:DinB family protein n=1 Tax=Paenibacillus arenilitoris TaxID=2772299 RepID=A0A927H5K0_9BACL|nr:DinB family protein [Paenibacillus arenilitoris]MBD2867634.1 DinB family protein [Paenibacillus arenilitoris]
MYTSVQNFIDDYRNESAGTQKLLDALTDQRLGQEIAPGFRTLGFLAWHLVTSSGLLLATGLRFDSVPDDGESPASAKTIAETYRRTAASILDAVQAQFTDEKLQESVDMFGQQWKIGYTLGAFIGHEIHHRGQITVLMRQAGLPVAGVYGPSKEEYAAMGVPAPK